MNIWVYDTVYNANTKWKWVMTSRLVIGVSDFNIKHKYFRSENEIKSIFFINSFLLCKPHKLPFDKTLHHFITRARDPICGPLREHCIWYIDWLLDGFVGVVVESQGRSIQKRNLQRSLSVTVYYSWFYSFVSIHENIWSQIQHNLQSGELRKSQLRKLSHATFLSFSLFFYKLLTIIWLLQYF